MSNGLLRLTNGLAFTVRLFC